jgi:hypothetical protein
MVVSQFMRHTSVADPTVAEATIHRHARHSHRADAEAAHATDAEVADTGASNNAHVGAPETADMTAAEAATATRESGIIGRCHSDHRGCGDCENFFMHCSLHGPTPFLFLAETVSLDRFNGTLIRGLPETRGSQSEQQRCTNLMGLAAALGLTVC